MRLIRRLERVEAAQASRAAAASIGAGIVWTLDNVPLGRELAEGESLAVDLYEVERTGMYTGVRSVERIASSAEDLGTVYDADGSHVLGRVVESGGNLLTVRYEDAVDRAAG